MRIRYTHDPFFKNPIAEITYDMKTENELVLQLIDLLRWKNWTGFCFSCLGKVALEVADVNTYLRFRNDYQVCKVKAKKRMY